MEIHSKKKYVFTLFLLIILFAFYSILDIHQRLVLIDKESVELLSFKRSGILGNNHREYKQNEVFKSNTNKIQYDTRKNQLKFQLRTFDRMSLLREFTLSNTNLKLLDDVEKLKKKIILLEKKLTVCDFVKETNIKLNKYDFIRKNVSTTTTTRTTSNWSSLNDEELTFSKIQDKYLQNEGDIYSYSAFTIDKLFPAELGIYRRNIIKLTGLRQKDLHSVIQTSIEHLNKKNPTKPTNFELKHFLIGFYRTTPVDGYEYELYFRKDEQCTTVRSRRALGPLKMIKSNGNSDDESETIRVSNNKIINFILPLTGGEHKNRFKYFLSSFETVAVEQDKSKCTLTIVYSYDKSNRTERIEKQNVENLLNEFMKRTNFLNIKFIEFNKTRKFSRAKLIEFGVENCCMSTTTTTMATTNSSSSMRNKNRGVYSIKNENLLFFCDVDVLFNRNFLDFCRFNTKKNEKVFFPILYSFYNSKLTQNLNVNNQHQPSTTESFILNTNKYQLNSSNDYSLIEEESARVNLVIDKDSGFWRDSGFGMVCIYKQDFESIGGFGQYANVNADVGWGGEDLFLFRKFLKTNYQLVRSVTPGIFHLYHQKECEKNLFTPSQYKDCLFTKILNEASQKTFGLYYFNLTNLN